MSQVFSFRRWITAPIPLPTSWYALPLMLIVGLGFVEHGYAKLSRGADAFVMILHAIGMPLAGLFGWATISVEVLGGLLVLAGALGSEPNFRLPRLEGIGFKLLG